MMDTDDDTEAIDTSLTSDAPPAAPFAGSASAGAETDRDPVTGRFMQGNLAALTHGARSRQVAALRAPAREALRRRVLADLAVDDASLSVTMSTLIDRFVESVLIAEAYIAALEHAGGPITTRGRQLAAVRGWLELLEVQTKLAGLIGLAKTRRPGADLSTLLTGGPKP